MYSNDNNTFDNNTLSLNVLPVLIDQKVIIQISHRQEGEPYQQSYVCLLLSKTTGTVAVKPEKAGVCVTVLQQD